MTGSERAEVSRIVGRKQNNDITLGYLLTFLLIYLLKVSNVISKTFLLSSNAFVNVVNK